MATPSNAPVLWIMDRYGMPGQQRAAWANAAGQAGLSPMRVKLMSMHDVLKGTLLTHFANRKAPTWRPERAEDIRNALAGLRQRIRPCVVVLTAPETLLVSGLEASIATIDNLRGSVYVVDGIPHVVTMPMSAWTMHSSIKEIQHANYGMLSAEAMERSIGDSSEDEEDGFFYEPLQVPTGKFFIQADLRKIARIANGTAHTHFPAYDFQPKVRI